MKNFILIIIVLFSIQSFSCVSYQEIDRNRIFNENEVDSKPVFPGRNDAMKEFMKEHLEWPEDYGYNGYVILSAVINKDGNITDAKVIRTLCMFCDKSALEVLKKMPKWTPGFIKKMPVNTRIQIPIRFELTE